MFSRARIGTFVLLVAGLVMLGAASAQAQTTTVSAPMAVSATGLARCTIAATALAFGNYDPTNPTPLDGTATVSIRCTRGLSATIGLDNGVRYNRTMSDGTDTLQYELYTDPARTTPWLDSAGGWQSYGPATSNAPTTLTVYGRVTPLADVRAGTSFTDTVQASIHF